MLNNNEILKKLRVALSLKDDEIVKILALSNFEMTKGAVGDLYRNEEHPNFKGAGDQVLRHFLNGLIIYKRGPLDKPKANVKDANTNVTGAVEPRYFENKKEKKIENSNGLKKRKRF